jgi:hypothetical protein
MIFGEPSVAPVKTFRAILAVLAALALGGCATTAPIRHGSARPEPSAPVAPADHPADLLGVWRVTGGPGEGGDSWIRFDERAVTLWRGCGVVEGSWRANNDLFVADTYLTYGEGCAVPDALAVEWLTRVESYTSTDRGLALLDADGGVVTTLVNDGSRPPPNPYNTANTGDPEVTPGTMSALDPGKPLPAGAAPATDILGRWIAADATSTSPEEPYVEFLADGTYTATEGCNATGGRWVLGDSADFLATAGIRTDMGCDMIEIPAWVSTAASIGTELDESDATVLTLYDRDGLPLGRLVSG